MEISERIKITIDDLGLTAGSFAKKIGVQRSTISHILTGRNKPSIDFLEKFSATFPDIDVTWLLTGKKLNRKIETNDESEERINEPSSKKKEKDIEKIIVLYDDGSFKDYIPS